ncbi:MAG: HAD-IA family hydrolase [Myxococcota bacterium]
MRVILFDLDGTLLDSVDLIITSFHYTTETLLGRRLPDERWLDGIGTPLRDQFSDLVGPEVGLDQFLQTYIAYNLAEHDRLAKPFPGVVEAVQKLHQRGTPMAMVTSKLSRGANIGLRLLGLEEALPVRVCADDVTHGKPHPEPVLKALSALQATPEEAIFIGDSVHDVVAGQRAGTTTAAVSWGPFSRETFEGVEPDRWFDHPGEWLEL